MRADTVLVKVKESASVNNLPLADLHANNLAHLYYTEEPPHLFFKIKISIKYVVANYLEFSGQWSMLRQIVEGRLVLTVPNVRCGIGPEHALLY